MKKLKRSIGAALLFANAAVATTLPAPNWHTFELDDGSMVELRLMGNSELHWYQNRDGNIIIQGDDGEWYFGQYQQQEQRGEIISTGVKLGAGVIAPEQSNVVSHPVILPAQRAFEPESASFNTRSLYERSQFTPEFVPTRRNQPLLVVQVSFTDAAMENDFTQRIFGQNQQSVRDYFLKNSNDLYTVVPARETSGVENDGVIDIVLPRNHPNCHSKTDPTCGRRLHDTIAAAYQALDNQFDLAPYDTDGNGSIKPSELSVMFVFAGFDRSFGDGNTPYIWPHRWAHNAVTLDGKTITDYCLFADKQGDHQSTMGVIAHELGHLMLGLPDLYAYEGDGSVGHWGLMGGGSWGRKAGDLYAGETPVNMLTWSKEFSGFIEPVVIDGEQAVTINTENDGGVIYLDDYLKRQGPRLYVENRRKQGYDRSILGEGLLMTSVNIDNPFNSAGPMQVQILQADGQDDLASGRGSDRGDVFPGSRNISTLSDDTDLSLRLVTSGRATGASISNIQSTLQSGSFLFNKPVAQGKSAWITTLGRDNRYFETANNAIGFGVDVGPQEKRLMGFHFYAGQTAVANSVDYVLYRYPYRTTWRGVSVDVAARNELGRGQLPMDGGRVMLAQPHTLPAGSSLLVLELNNGQPEFTYSFMDSYLTNSGRKPQFEGSVSDYLTSGLRGTGGKQYPFAALLEDVVLNPALNAQNDQFQIMEDTAAAMNLVSNDIAVPERYRIELGEKPRLGSWSNNRYVPNLNATGRDRFTYRIVGIQGEVSNYAEVTVNILPINDAPTFDLELNQSTLEMGSKIRLSAVRVNDVDSSRVTINWRQLSGPATHWNSVDTYSINIELRENIAVDQNIIFRAIISDNEGAKTEKDITIVAKSQAINLGGGDVSIEFGQSITLDLIKGLASDNVSRIEILQYPIKGKAYIQDMKLIYEAPNSSDLPITESVKFKVVDQSGNEWESNYTISARNKSTLAKNTESDSDGGSMEFISLFAFLFLMMVRQRGLSNNMPLNLLQLVSFDYFYKRKL
ncbi:M6 family metalloprotease domain-containing protein [Vibrio mimicus]|uniref:M6 family metalloprotease domain-containing protein n=1 Tax=Vibrio mimicus TaxID=674 RepID=UPI002F95E83D